MSEVTAVTAGQSLTIPGDGPVLARPACESKDDGYWYCVTHRQGFPGQLAKDFHIAIGDHELSWLCRVHGHEQP